MSDVITSTATLESVAHPLVQIRHLTKSFVGVRALDDVELDILPGEVHALVGQNGSGKSTLIKILSGYHRADPGSEITVDGKRVGLTAEEAARHDRIRFVHQDLGIVLPLSALDNLALRGGFKRHRSGRIDWKAQTRHASQLLTKFDVVIDPARPLAEASPLERTVVALAGALQGWNEQDGLLVLDEPTAVLPHEEARRLLTMIREMRSRGTSVLYVSHRLDEVLEVADRVSVLRNGRKVATVPVPGLSKRRLVSLMLGVEIEPDYRADIASGDGDDVVLEASGLTGRFLRDASIGVRRGEIVGLIGLPGSGHNELPYALAGVTGREVSGAIRHGGDAAWTPVGRPHPSVALVPADRGSEGIVSEMSVTENLTLGILNQVRRRGVLSRDLERSQATRWLERLRVDTRKCDAPIRTLSGGNQQKILIGRCLARNPSVLLMCEPTAGVDLGARRAIHEFIAEQARTGLSVVVASSDVGDLVALCTRVLVMRNGAVVQELAGEEIRESTIVHAVEGTTG